MTRHKCFNMHRKYMEGHILDQQLPLKYGTDERNKDFNFYNIVIYNI